MNKTPNRAVMCEALMENARVDSSIVVLCSDSRGSASLAPFADAFPNRFVEVGIAEQNLVGIAAGLASCGKKCFAVSPACFLSTRCYEQIKVDCAYSNVNVKLVGISGGISYGALGMTHHSLQDVAAIAALPGMRVYLPSDRYQTKWLFETLCHDERPAYIRLGRNPVEDIYGDIEGTFVMDKASRLMSGGDVAIIACGEMAHTALEAGKRLKSAGISASVLDMFCVKPLDTAAVLEAASAARLVVTLEEHAPYGGLGSMVSQALAQHCPRKMLQLSLPDEPIISGAPDEVLRYYGLTAQAVTDRILLAFRGQPDE